jgi:hypothetical protein
MFIPLLSLSAASSFACSLPPFKRKRDVVLLALLCATAKKDDYLLTFFPKIHAIAGTKIDLAFVIASPNTFGIGEISQSYAV